MRILILFVWSCICLPEHLAAQSGTVFELTEGHVAFTSDAPLELIEAETDKFRGAIDVGKRTFAFSIAISSFEGFNSPLQREHFNENYLESDKFPSARFLGKIIETVDLRQDGDYVIRAKGKLNIHGKERERIIKTSVRVSNGILSFSSAFTVPLRDHDIEIPRIVFQKIAEEITVELDGQMELRNP